MKIAGCMPTYNYNHSFKTDCQAFQTLKRMTDVTIILDDNSFNPLPNKYIELCDEYIRMIRPNPKWLDFGNRMTLFYRAFVHECEWILMIDDDWILDASLNTRQDIINLIDRALGYEVIMVKRKDLFENKEHPEQLQYRSDGVWDRKDSCLLYKNPFFKQHISFLNPKHYRLHRRPDCLPRGKTKFFPDVCLYHFGFYDHHRRSNRYMTYQQIEDPDNQFQPDYQYITDLDGIKLTPVPQNDAEKINALINQQPYPKPRIPEPHEIPDDWPDWRKKIAEYASCHGLPKSIVTAADLALREKP